MNTAVAVMLVVLGGLAVGSFLCVVIDRLPVLLDEPAETGETWGTRPWPEVLGGRSRCSTCGADVRPRDNLPVVGWLLLRGRCRDCGDSIPAFHPLVEATVAGLAVLVYVVVGVNWQLPAAWWLVGPGVAIAVIDARTLIVPTRLVWPMFAGSVGITVVSALVHGTPAALWSAVIGSLAAAGPLFVIWFILPSGMGFGDVRLCVVLGWHVGFAAAAVDGRVLLAVTAAVLLLLIAAIVGIVTGIVLKVGFGRRLAFGPGLVAAAILLVVWAESILGPFVSQ